MRALENEQGTWIKDKRIRKCSLTGPSCYCCGGDSRDILAGTLTRPKIWRFPNLKSLATSSRTTAVGRDHRTLGEVSLLLEPTGTSLVVADMAGAIDRLHQEGDMGNDMKREVIVRGHQTIVVAAEITAEAQPQR